MSNNLILMGFKASGKTTLGSILANKLHKPFYDTDQLIMETYEHTDKKKASCFEIFSEQGEEFFRKKEQEIIFSLQKVENSVIATGGGSFLLEENQKFLQNLGLLIYLDVPLMVIQERLARLKTNCFTDYKSSSLEKEWKKRRELFQKLAQITLTVDGDIETMIERIETYGK